MSEPAEWRGKIESLARKMRELERPVSEGWKTWEQSRLKDKYLYWASLVLKAEAQP